MFQGSPDAVCSAEGQWTGGGGLPSCVPRPCGPPPVPPHARAPTFQSEGGYHLGYGSVARLACEAGYVAAGGELTSLTCAEDGTWKGDILPCVKVCCRARRRVE